MKSKIFLVDDEQPVLDGLSVTIRKALPELDICGTARSGREAIEAIDRERPDLVIMDVRMPGMSGLDALRELRRRSVDCIAILLTAYERFDIAKEAFSLGVYEYLVKPVEQDALTAVLRGAIGRQQELKAASLRAVGAQEELELARPLLEAGFVYAAILSPPGSSLVASFGERLGLGSTPTGHMVALAGYEDEGELRRRTTNRLACIMGPPLGGLLPLFVSGEKTDETRRALEDLAGDDPISPFHFSLGSVRPAAELRRSWTDALGGLAAEGGTNLPEAGESWEYLFHAVEALRRGDQGRATASFAHWALWRRDAGGNAPERALAAGLLVLMAGAGPEEALAAYGAQASVLDAAPEDMAVRAANLLSLALSAAVPPQAEMEGATDRRVRTVLRFIADNYDRPISLEDAADAAGISSAHLSRLLASETGASFTEHVTERRIERACKELAEGSRSVKEIAGLCGYPDANYFSRAFKRVLGLTPTEYAGKHGRAIL